MTATRPDHGGTEADTTDSDYLRALGVEPKFKRALGFVTGSLLVRRLQGWPKTESKFNLRRWGLPVTVVALAWTIFVLIDAAWPRAATNPNLGSLPVIEYLGIGVIVVGTVWWFVSLRGKSRPDREPADAVPIESN